MKLLVSTFVLLAYILTCHYQVSAAEPEQYNQPFINTDKNNDYTGFMDNFIGFTCEATGTNLEYFWKHKDQLITKDTPLKFPKLNSSTLQPIKQNIELAYEGPYQCFAKNRIGTVFGRKANVKFTVVGKFFKNAADVPITSVGVILNTHTPVYCPKHRYSYNVNYIWEYMVGNDPQTFEQKQYYFITNNGTLYFSSITQKIIDDINGLGGIRCTQRATYMGETRSRSSHLIKLTVKNTGALKQDRPAIIEISESQSVKTREKIVTLKCGAVGNPVPTLKWFRKSSTGPQKTEIKNGGGFELNRFNQYLVISDVTGNKAGSYVCQATNVKGVVERETQLSVQDRPQWTVNGALTDIRPPIDNQHIWTCMALGGATFTWYKDGIKLDGTSAGKFEINDQRGKGYSSLVIRKMAIDYNGMYECTAANEKDTIYSIGRLEVKENKPVFTEQMGPITLIETKEGRIPCPVDAAPLPTIVWKKDKQRLDLTKSEYRLAPNKLDLIITNVTKEDKGNYLCRATNKLGDAEDSSDITIGVDISWVSKPSHNTNVSQSLKFELDCEAKGDPSYEVKYRWLRNGLPLQYSARVHWVKDQHRLLVLDSIVSDTGTYTCIAFAETPLYISKEGEALVEVKAAPNPPDYVAIDSDGSCWNRDAKLIWRTASLNNEGELWYTVIEWSTTYEPANWTFLAKKEEGAHPGSKATEGGTELKLNFDDLPPYSHISFRVTLVNRLGSSEPSRPSLASDCVTRPSAPPHPPREIMGEAAGPNTLTLVWTPVRQTYWGAAGFTYVVQFRRKTRNKDDSRWNVAHQVIIKDGHNNSLPVYRPGYYNEWEFRVKSQNRNGSSAWKYGTAFSGQDPPSGRPSGLTRDRIAARSADISWNRVTPPKNGTITGYLVRYWYSVKGVDIDYSSSAIQNRKKREAEDDEYEVSICFDPKNPCEQESSEKESQLVDLEPYKMYHIKIAAYNSGGRGPFSEEINFETADDKPGPPYAALVFSYSRFAKLTWKIPRHPNGKILGYQVHGNGIVTTELPWWAKRHIIYELNPESTYEAMLRARTSSGWGESISVWFNTTSPKKPAKPLVPECMGYGENAVNVTFMEPKPTFIRKYGGEIYDDPWEYRPVGGFENEHRGTGGYPARFYVLFRKAESQDEFQKTEQRQMWGEQDQTWIVIENLQRLTIYEFATVPVNDLGEGPRSDIAIALPGGIVPKVKKLYWYQRDWFIALAVLFGAACLLFLIIVLSTKHLKNIYYEGAPKRRKDREKERIYEPEDVNGGFDEFTLKSARSSRSVVTSRSGPPPPYSNGGTSRHSGDFDDENELVESDEESDDEKNEVSTYYSDDKKIPLDDLDDDEDEESSLATFV